MNNSIKNSLLAYVKYHTNLHSLTVYYDTHSLSSLLGTHVHSCSFLINQSCGRGTVQKKPQLDHEIQVMFTSNIRMKRKCDLSDFDCGMFVVARWEFQKLNSLYSLHRMVQKIHKNTLSKWQFCCFGGKPFWWESKCVFSPKVWNNSKFHSLFNRHAWSVKFWCTVLWLL